MNTNKFLIGGIIGGIAYFLLGWIVWGMLLADFMKGHMTTGAQGIMRPQEGMVWWAMIAANLLMGFLLSYILSKSGTNSAGSGAGTGVLVGILMSGAFDLLMYGQMDMGDTTMIGVDVIMSGVVTAIVGGIIGAYLGMGKKAVA